MNASLGPVMDPTRCPKCGTGRLIRRYARYEDSATAPPISATVRLRFWFRRRQGHAVLHVSTYHCELCGHHWRALRIESAADGAPR
ncbi:MAG: hypothetical protein FJZ90_03330 [Chloroflexi bacterium]|nr:hypothetical protein [Chloroflexota bacterium]